MSATKSASLSPTGGSLPCLCSSHHFVWYFAGGLYRAVPEKSLTKVMYCHEISVDGEGGDISGAVRFDPFIGVSPRLYSSVFRYRPRKNKYGSVVHWNSKKAMPQGAGTGEAYLAIEANKSGSLTEFSVQYQELKSGKNDGRKEGNSDGEEKRISRTSAKRQRSNKATSRTKKGAPRGRVKLDKTTK